MRQPKLPTRGVEPGAPGLSSRDPGQSEVIGLVGDPARSPRTLMKSGDR